MSQIKISQESRFFLSNPQEYVAKVNQPIDHLSRETIRSKLLNSCLVMIGKNTESIQNDLTWIRRLGNNPYIRNVATLLSGTAFAQIITLLIAPALSRLYTPAQIGELTVLNSICGIGAVIATLKYEMAIIVADNDEEADLLGTASILISALFSGISIVVIGVIQLFFVEYHESWHWFIPMTILLQTIFFALGHRANYSKQYKWLSVSKIIQASGNGAWAIGFAFLSKPLLLLAPLTGYLVGAISLKNTIHLNFDWQKIKRSLAKHKKYAVYTTPSTLLDVASQQAPIFAITWLFSKEMTGHYGISVKVLYLPVTFLGAAVSQVFYKSFAERWVQPGRDDFGLLVKTWSVLALIGLVPFGILFFYAEPLFSIVFGDNWIEAGKMTSLLCPMLYVIFISSPSSTAVLVQNKHQISFFFGLAVLIYRPLCLYYGHLKGDLYTGLKLWVTLEIIQVLLYNFIIGRNCWKK